MRRLAHECSLLVVGVVCCLSAFSLAEEPAVLELRVEAGDWRILPFEPLSLRLVLSNPLNEEVRTSIGLNRLGMETRLLTAPESGEFNAWRRSWEPDMEPSPLPEVSLMPGQEASDALECFWQADVPVFAEAGEFKVKVEWRGSGARAESAEYPVSVVDGTARDKECLDRLRGRGLQAYLALETVKMMPASDAERLQVIDGLYEAASHCADSRYGEYALATLLHAVEAGKVDERLRGRILSEARRQIKEQPRPRVLVTYARAIQADHHERTREYLRQAMAMHPDPVVVEMIRRLDPDL